MTMTIQGFISKMSGRISAESFLKQHREYMLSGELSSVLTPIIEKIDNGELSAKTGLINIQQSSFNYFMDKKAAEAVNSINKSSKPSSQKMYTAAIYNEDGSFATYIDNNGDEKDLIFNTDNSLQAESWCHRKLFDAAPNCYGKVVNKVTGFVNEVSRDSAIAAILRTGPIGAYRKTGSDGKSWKMKVKNDHFHFSHG